MRGHIVKRGKDSYSVVISLGTDPATGKRRQQWVTTKGTKRDAERRLGEVLHQLDTGAFMRPGKISVADYLKKWLTDYAKPNLAPRSVEGYQTIISQHLIPRLGAILLTQLKPEHIQNYYAGCLTSGRCDASGGLNPLTVRHHHMVLHKALQTAVEWGLIIRNPADGVKPPRGQPKEMTTLTEDDMRIFLEAAKKTPYYALFYTALFTGMRRSEILALRWCDTDLLLCQISVTRTLHHLKDGSYVYRQPKSAKGRRSIALSPSTAVVFREHREKIEAERLFLGLPALQESDLVFAHYDGSPLRPNTVTRAWSNLAKKCGVKASRFHDARHSHASLMLKQGVHPKVVQERLGHATIAVTLDTYSHVAPGLQELAAQRFDDAFKVSHNTNVESVR